MFLFKFKITTYGCVYQLVNIPYPQAYMYKSMEIVQVTPGFLKEVTSRGIGLEVESGGLAFFALYNLYYNWNNSKFSTL